MGAHTFSHALVALLLGAATFAVTRRSLRAGIAVVLMSLVRAGSSLPGLTAYFLTARWGALFGFAEVLVPRGLAALGPIPRRASLVAALPVVAFASVAWSVEPRLTLERSATFAVLVVV